MKVIFFGTPEFVVSIPQALLKTANCKLLAVVTQPDKPAGRKQISTPSPVKSWAQEHKIKVIDSDIMIRIIRAVKDLTPDVCILAAYGKILPPELLKIPRYGFLNVHPSLLPKYRGASPVQAAILNGEAETGVTIIKLDDKMDHGPIIAQFTEPIKPDDTAESLYFRLFEAGAKVSVTILPAWIEGRIEPREQDHKKATFTKILKREGGHIDLNHLPSPEVFERMVRAYHPWPGVWTRQIINHKSSIIKFLPGNKIQPEGKKPMSIKDFLNGYPETKTWLSKLCPLSS